MSQKRVLIVSRYFPPAFDVGGRRAYHFARYLPDFGFVPTVVTAREPSERARDTAPLRLPDCVRVVREYDPVGMRASGARLSDGTVATPVASRRRRGLGALLGKQLSLPLGGDAKLVPHLRRVLMRVIAEERPDVIFASSSPYATLVAGFLAGRATGTPVCLDLRDPWSLNFLQRDRAAWIRFAEARLERYLFRSAAQVTVTSEATARAYRELYPELSPDRIATVRNSFDPIRRPRGGPKEGPLRLIHFGNCYGSRSLSTIIRALAEFRRAHPGEAIELSNLGRVSQADLDLAAEVGVADAFSYQPVVPYDAGIELLARADLQVLLGYGEETLFIPAKFYDYLLAGSPILCVARPSELTELVSALHAGGSVEPGDVAGTVRLIEAALAARRAGVAARLDPQSVEGYSAPRAAEALARVLNAAIERASGG